jgi:RND family efflux transporter MFP subunit
MRKIIVFSMTLFMILFFSGCGKGSGGDTGRDGNGEKENNRHAEAGKREQVDRKDGNRGNRERGDKRGADGNGGNKGENKEIDLNGPEVPQRLKDAIKSGRITPERAKQMLQRMRGGGGRGEAPAVKVQKAERKAIHSFLALNGVVEPERKVEVYSRLSAYVKNIVKEEGDLVKKDDILALLDDTEISISYKQAEIQLEQAKLTLEDEEAKFKRSQQLKDTDMISEQDFQASKAAYDKAKLDHQTRRENFKDLQLQLSYTKMRSPVSGYVTERVVEVGSRVNSNQKVYTVEDFSPLLVKVFVPSADIVNLKTGMETDVTTDVLAGRTFTGTIKLINPRIDVQSGTVKVTVEVFDESNSLKPGMFVETKILIKNNPNALVIPRKCISYKNNRAFVFVFQREGMNVAKRFIEVGVTEGDDIEVTGGMEEGERVVTVGFESLKDNMKVNVVR